jgi:hypothetical protein
MTDRAHLNELVAAIASPLSRRLLETFRDMVRDPAVGTADYATRLKAAMEDGLQEEPQHAASDANNS